MKKSLLLLISFFCVQLYFCTAASFGQVFDSEISYLPDTTDIHDYSTPYHTTYTFFYHLNEQNFDPSIAAEALNMDGSEGQNAEALAVMLKQVFDGNGVYVYMNDVPNTPNYRDTVRNGKQIYVFDEIILPAVYLEKVGNQWLFSSATVQNIKSLHKETYPFGTDKLLTLLPKLGSQVYFGLHLWQLFGLFFLLLMVFISHKLFTFLVDRGLYFMLVRSGYGKIAKKYLLPVARIVSIYLIVLFLAIFIRVLQLPISIVSWVTILLNAVKPFIVTVIFYKLVDVFSGYMERMAEKTRSTLDDQLVPLVRKTLKAFVIVVGSLFVLKYGLRIDIVPFLTGLSIGGLAFALAAQDTIKNFFGSVMIFVDKPFQVGDWITSGDVDGTVEEVGFRSTRVRTFRNSLMYIPNGKIADATVDNHGLRKYRRFYSTITITYDTPPELVEVFLEGLRRIVQNHPKTRKDYYNIYLNNLSAYSLDIMFYVFFEVPSWPEELKAREDLILAAIRLANKLEVRFAFPTQTLHMESFPEKQGFTPVYEGEKGGYQKKLDQFIKGEINGEQPS
ncbi:mechanosensitive ion channel family protein [Cyclobacterium jeungdonense]|uniref:Mechanosensitive ion channel family protein n=1 Tax=Cyclobacterium jeungdonense TaxID=708087 RepID=A0ABT8C3Z4_9BACT|nr:mechanosensitive ion channel family protein [Cyclobacterium jeungdonense]MDN3687092.1 mechanosensitive ion channel family protein [Cyclobacterium jeungdonense]